MLFGANLQRLGTIAGRVEMQGVIQGTFNRVIGRKGQTFFWISPRRFNLLVLENYNRRIDETTKMIIAQESMVNEKQ